MLTFTSMSTMDDDAADEQQPGEQGRVWGFKPLEWQHGFIHSEADEVLGSGAFGAGKTRALNEKIYIRACLFPGNRILLARKTYASITNTTLKSLLEEVIPESHVVGTNQQKHLIQVQSPFYPTMYCERPDCEWTATRMVPVDKRPALRDSREFACPECGDPSSIAFTPPSEIYYEGLNTGTRPGEMPEKIAGMNLGDVAVDEAIEITEKDWEMLQGRLRLKELHNPFVPELPQRQIYSATNPAGPNHWLYKRFYEQGVGEVYEGKTEDNIHNPDDYLARQQRQLSGTDAERLIGGSWVGYEGLVYDEFSDAIHVLDPLDVPDVLGEGWHIPDTARADLRAMEADRSTQVGDPATPGDYQPARVYPPEDVPVVMAIDWGYRPDPMVVQWWADTATHGYVLYRELFRTRTLPDPMADEAVQRMATHEVENVRAVYADHDSGDRADWEQAARAAVREDADLADTMWRRLRTTKAKKARAEGVRSVKRVLQPDEHDRAALHFVRGARAHQIDGHLADADAPGSTLAEIRGYSWKDDDSDKPQDGDDHGMDTMRYAVHTDRKVGRRGDSGGAAVFNS